MTSAYDQGHIPNFELRHRLQLAREYAGYDRQQLADKMEISRNSVLNAETGRTTPRKIVLNTWALACGVPVSWIITGQPPAGGPDPDNGSLDYKDAPRRVSQLRTVLSAGQRVQQVQQHRAS